MPGPNSAPNGDRNLVTGYSLYDWMYCETCKKTFVRRDHLAKHKMLRTGKTAGR